MAFALCETVPAGCVAMRQDFAMDQSCDSPVRSSRGMMIAVSGLSQLTGPVRTFLFISHNSPTADPADLRHDLRCCGQSVGVLSVGADGLRRGQSGHIPGV